MNTLHDQLKFIFSDLIKTKQAPKMVPCESCEKLLEERELIEDIGRNGAKGLFLCFECLEKLYLSGNDQD